jgi:hypothetical protein
MKTVVGNGGIGPESKAEYNYFRESSSLIRGLAHVLSNLR